MPSPKIFCSLLFLTLFLVPTQGADIIPQRIEDPQPKKPPSMEYKPINITFDHSNVNLTHPSFILRSQYLNESILPPIQSYLRAAVKVLPRSSKIIAKPGICNDVVQVPAYASETGYNSDLVIFMKIDGNPVYQVTPEYFVQGAACGLDETTGRPTVGVITFNRITIDELVGGSFLKAENNLKIEIERRMLFALNEIIHILGFQDKLFPYYINPETRQPLTGHLFNKTVNDVNTLVLNLAPLTQRVRSYFKCPTAEGAYLENQGDNMTMNSHFERRIFGNELMTAGEMFDRKISQFTLALLEGTGWYKVNYELAEPMTYGKDQGCAFLDTKCIDPVTKKPNFKEFCPSLTLQNASLTKRGYGYCGRYSVNTDKKLPAAFDYWGNQTIVEDKYSDNCPYFYTPYDDLTWQSSRFPQALDCENLDYAPYVNLKTYETRGIGSKAFMGTLSETNNGRGDSFTGFCFEPKCVSKSDGNYAIQIPFGTAGVVTCSIAGLLDASNFGFKHKMGGSLECPNPNEFCEQILAEGYCKGACYGNGVCSERKCVCKEGWTSETCLTKTEVSKAARCTRDGLRTTAFGDDCICSPFNNTCQCALGLKTGDICNKRGNSFNGNNQNTAKKPTWWEDRALDLIGGAILLVAAVVIFCMARCSKKADDLKIALNQSSDVSIY